jgi:major membrane immunogen (membrane-anchored lipoprotein)
MVLAAASLANCKGSSYKNGEWTGKSGEDDTGAYGEVTVIIKNSEITDCRFITWQKDGTVKDENYGKINGEISNQEYYAKAQLAVVAMKQYAEQFKTLKDLSKIDAVSGATIAWEQFTEAARNALDKARE